MTFRSVNPADGSLVAEYAAHSEEEIDRLLTEGVEAQRAWKQSDIQERCQLLERLVDVLEQKKERFAQLMTQEMGKPISQAKAEVEKCAWVCRYYAECGPDFIRDQLIATEAAKSGISYQPLGLILAVMPWNFPFWQVFRFLAPAIMAGNACALKHASSVTGTALAIEEALTDAKGPKGLLRVLKIKGREAPKLMSDERIAAVTLTGSTSAGRAVGAAAGEALKPSVLELGGSDAYVILADADVAQAASVCAESRMINNGQSCIAAKRFIVQDSVHDEFVKHLRETLAAYAPGDPTDEECRLGPMAQEELRDELHDQVQESLHAGAKARLGAEVPARKGAWYPATLLTNVSAGMKVFDEETFGPVAAVVRAETEDEAFELANASAFGLGGAVFTRDLERGWRLASERLEAGCCSVNALVKSDPRLPFGGIKQSGYGRELSSFGIREFMNVKSVWLEGDHRDR